MPNQMVYPDQKIHELSRKNSQLRATLRHIEELATDTPTPEDSDVALNAIKRACEDALS